MTVVGAGLEEAADGQVMCRAGRAEASCTRKEGVGVVCELPGQGVQRLELEVSSDGGERYGRSGAVFEYVRDGAVVKMVPSEGPVGGVTRVQVVGEHFRAEGETGCLFGRGGEYVTGRWESSSMVHCTSPGRETEGGVRVVAVTDGVEMSGEEDGGLFVYREWPRVVSVDPAEGVAGEETVVRVGMAGGGTAGGGRARGVQGGREGATGGAGDDREERGVQAAGEIAGECDGGGEPERGGLGRRGCAV